jgi:putative membrane protein
VNVKKNEPVILLITAGVFLIISEISPYDRVTWLLEVSPILIGFPLLIATYSRFPLTPLLYRLILIHALILIAGAHYTYARVPMGFWIQDLFDLSRNHYDRIGHFAQGFVPAILARELLLRCSPLNRGKWLFFIVAAICLAFTHFMN